MNPLMVVMFKQRNSHNPVTVSKCAKKDLEVIIKDLNRMGFEVLGTMEWRDFDGMVLNLLNKGQSPLPVDSKIIEGRKNDGD